MEAFKSRKFLLALAGAIVAFGNAMFDWGISQDQMMLIMTPILTYIGVEGVRDIREAGQA